MADNPTGSSPKDDQYPVERLLDESTSFFEVERHVVVGALHLAKLDNRKHLSRADVDKALKAFDKHEVVTESDPEEA